MAPKTSGHTPPPLRADPSKGDSYDGARLDYLTAGWKSQDAALRPRDRQVEENVRMLAGQQWHVFSAQIGRFLDISEWLTDAERRWRQRPVINWLVDWFIVTHARMTENPPILTWVPGPDRQDAELAEVLDITYKVAWRDANMVDVWDRVAAWMIAGGRGYLLSRIDLSRGPWQPWVGQAQLPLVGPDGRPIAGPDGQPMLGPPVPGVPFALGPDGKPQPQGVMTPDGPMFGDAKPHQTRAGMIVADVLSPLEARGEWGPAPWHEKRWHATVGFYTPEQVYELTGMEVDPDTTVGDVGAGSLDRLLMGAGFFGAAAGLTGALGQDATDAKKGLVTLYQRWERPCRYPGMEEAPGQPGGRYSAWTPAKLLRDGPRPIAFPYTSPVSCFDFVRLPGRPAGTTPLEALVGPQRNYNKNRAQLNEHANLTSNPKFIVDKGSGIKNEQWTNQPGTGVVANRRAGVPAVEWLTPPQIGQDVYRILEIAREEIEAIGHLKGLQGEPLSPDQSGEAIKELRFNSDRFLGTTLRRSVEEFARMAETWRALMPVIYDEARVLSLAGDDNVARTVTVLPELWEEGRVDVIPDTESMLPEGRGERQAQAFSLYQNGVFGPVGTPQAIRHYLEMSRFPHLARAAKPGGVDRTTAEQENGRLTQGTPAMQVPVFEWYDHVTHLEVHEELMKGPEFLKLPPPVQIAFEQHRMMHLTYVQQMMAQQAALAAPAGAPGGGEGGGAGGAGGGAPGAEPSADETGQPGATPNLALQGASPPASVPADQYPTAV